MNTQELLNKYGRDEKDRLLLSRFCDLVRTASNQYRICYTSFLTPPEQAFLSHVTELRRDADISFVGGYEDAERRLARIAPLDYFSTETENIPIHLLEIQCHGAQLSHRDILGSLMGLGIKREKIGDILNTATPQLLFCDTAIAEFLLLNLTKIGHSHVALGYGQLTELPEREVVKITTSVASLRLDSVVAEGFHLSRSKAVEALKHGLVFLNWEQNLSPSKEVKEGDKISLKGMGKIELAAIGGLSKKGRIFLQINCYQK